MNDFLHKTDQKEMQRRWAVTLQAMKAEGIDCLLTGAFSRIYGGTMKYLLDVSYAINPVIGLFAEDSATVVGHGNRDGRCLPPYATECGLTGCIGVPAVTSSAYGDGWIAEQIVDEIKKHGYKRIGFAGTGYLTANHYKHITENLPTVEFVDATDMMDQIRAIKSPYELDMLEKCVRLHDHLIAAVPAILRVGKTEKEIVHTLEYLAVELGSPEVNVIVASHPQRPIQGASFYAVNTIKPGDYVQVLVEVAGVGGVWCEVGRTFSMGEPSAEMQKAWKDGVNLQTELSAMAKPGVSVADLHVELDKRMADMGYLPELRIFAHGQGYDMVERPIFVKEETIVLAENMFFSMHPTCINDKVSVFNCDNYVVTKDGGRRLNCTSPDIVILDG